MLSILQPKRPTHRFGWRLVAKQPLASGYPNEAWVHDANSISVITAVEVARDPGQPDVGPEYHISISACGERCSATDALWALAQFDLSDAKEDNHVPGGKVRNYWRAVADNLGGSECKCIDDEPAIREDKGDYVWRGVS